MSNTRFDADSLRAALGQHDLSSSAAANLIGCNRSLITRALRDPNKPLGEGTCRELAKVLPDTDFAAAWTTKKRASPNNGQPVATAAASRDNTLPANVALMRLDDLKPGGLNPRKHFDAEGIQDLAADIARRGLLQSLVILAPYTGEAGRTMAEIVGGERRYRAFKLLQEQGNWPPKSMPGGLILCTITSANPLSAAEICATALVENMQRVNLTPLEEAEAFADLIESGWTKKKIAAELGNRTVRNIEQRLDLLKLTPAMRTKLEAGEITIEAARTIAREPVAVQAKAAETGIMPAPKKAQDKTPDTTPDNTPDPDQLDAFPDTAPPAHDDDWEGQRPGEANEDGVIRPTETETIWKDGSHYHVKIYLACSPDGWRYSIDRSDKTGHGGHSGRCGPIRNHTAPHAHRSDALAAAAAELARYYQAQSVDTRTPSTGRRCARSILHALAQHLAPDDAALAVIQPDPEGTRGNRAPQDAAAESPTTKNTTGATAAAATDQHPTCLDDFTAKQRKTLMRRGFLGMAPFAEINRDPRSGGIAAITLIDPDTGDLISLKA